MLEENSQRNRIKKRSEKLKGRIFSEEHRRKIGLKHKNKVVSKETRILMSKCKTGVPWNGKHTDEFKEKIRNIFLNNRGWMKGCKHSLETIRKMRLTSIKKIEDKLLKGQQICPNYNSSACKIIEEYGKENGYNFQHAENGGEYHIKELGYWVDGYDKEKNIVVEYYEKKHDKKIYKDLNREIEICNYLSCDFIILWE